PCCESRWSWPPLPCPRRQAHKPPRERERQRTRSLDACQPADSSFERLLSRAARWWRSAVPPQRALLTGRQNAGIAIYRTVTRPVLESSQELHDPGCGGESALV